LAKRVKRASKVAQGTREVNVIPTVRIRPQYRQYKLLFPEIKDSIKIFNEYKRVIPPRELPGKMKDHVLDGKLKGIRECHLAPDVLLLYTHEGDTVRMLYICQHEDLYGKRAKQIAALIKELL
jgi:addiction module RelE/StbE family toxin